MDFSARDPVGSDGDALPAAADLFLELADLDLADRAARLAAVEDEALRREVEALLAADAEAGAVLGRLDRLATPPLWAFPTALPPGTRVGAYRLVAEIGRGGMGVVYRAEDTRLGRAVALKFLPAALGTDREARDRLVAEARAASALDHPNVCTVHDIGETEGGQLYLVLAHYEGETLKERLGAGPLSAEEAARVARGVAAGLAAAHRRGVVHRDVKPSNVLLAREGADGASTVKLLDFGIARRAGSDLTRTGAALGTAAYMAPEQTRGERVDARADVWALGVVLYEMLAGRRPFAGPEAALVHAIRHDTPPPLPQDTPPGLARIVAKALAKDPAERYRDAVALLADLEAGAIVSKPRPRPWPLAVAAGFALVAVAAFLVLRARDTAEPVPDEADEAFVIAVAPFAAVGEAADAEAGVMQALVRRALDAVLGEEGGVRVVELRGAAPRMRGEAEALGAAAGAHLVVWGDVVALGDEVEILPSLVRATPYPGAAPEASDLAGAASFRADLTEDNQLALRRTAAAEVGDLALLIAARAYAERDEPDRTLALLGRLHRASAEGERVAGLAHTLRYDFGAAEAHLRTALALDSTSLTTWEWLATMLMNHGRPAEAETEVRRALALFPNQASLHVVLAWSLSWQGRPAEAAVAASEAVRLAPESATARLRLGWAYFMLGRLEAAAREFTRAAAEAEAIVAVDSYEGLSEVRFAQGRFVEAEAAARAALRLRPDHAVEHDLLARALLAQGRVAEAERAWTAAAARTTAVYSTAVYYPLLVAYARTRLGRPDADADLRALADTLSVDRFLAPVLRFAVGETTAAAVLAEAAGVSPRLGRDWLREAHWMLGTLYEAGVADVPADTAKALAHYREATAREYFPEGALSQLTFALMDLERKAGATR
jgi:serine/threonine-protein kinase